MSDLFQAVRESCTSTVWSKGVELVRKDAVTGDSVTSEELVLRVATEAGINPTVRLFPEDLDWVCNCNGDDDPCCHVAAAVIALRRAKEQGQQLPKSKHAAARVAYALNRTQDGLALTRYVVHDDQARDKLTVSLTALASGRVQGPEVTATKEDMEIELALQGHLRPPLPQRIMGNLLKHLATQQGVTLDGTPINIRSEAIGILCHVDDEGPGVRVYGKQDKAITEVFTNGVALAKTPSGSLELRPTSLPALTPVEADILRAGRFFGRQEFNYLVGELLPSIEAKLPLVISSRQLPKKATARPRIELFTRKQQNSSPGIDHQNPKSKNTLAVTPRIVYGKDGDEVYAWIEHGQLLNRGTSVPIRDLDEERRLKDELRRSLAMEIDVTTHFTGEAGVVELERFQRWAQTGGGTLSGSGIKAFSREAPLLPELSFHDDGLSLRFTTNSGAAEPDIDSVLGAWRDGASLVPLLDGGYAPLPTDWLARYGDKLLEFLSARRALRDDRETTPSSHIRLPQALLPAMADFAEELGYTQIPDWLTTLKARLQGKDATTLPDMPPAGLTAQLRPYQEEGIARLAQLRSLELGALLADDMGLGKTLQAICLLEAPALVVAPTSVTHNWMNEIRKFRPQLRTTLYHGAGRSLDQNADVVITTYALLRMERDKLAKRDWRVLVLDEAQMIKNPSSQAAQAARRIPASFRLCLSGTPVENRLDDLWSQMHFLNPGLLGEQRFFNEHFARRIEAGDAEVAARLRSRIKPFIVRRLKREVAADLPPRTDTVLYVELSPQERAQYEALQAATRGDVLKKLAAGGSVIEILEALLRMRQACCHPQLIPGSDLHVSSKLSALVEKLQELTTEGHKALVFSQWTSLLDLIEPALECASLGFTRLDGSTKDRGAIVQDFQAENGPPILLMSLKAGGVGLNLTAADHVFIMDPWWNPAAEDQAADRAHRIGQERPVLVHRLVALNTVEERILELQARKRELAAAVTEAHNMDLSRGLSRDDLLRLFD